jgi:hypothetical protein
MGGILDTNVKLKFEYKDKDIYNKKQIVYEKDFA